jgi:hypothetical protein
MIILCSSHIGVVHYASVVQLRLRMAMKQLSRLVTSVAGYPSSETYLGWSGSLALDQNARDERSDNGPGREWPKVRAMDKESVGLVCYRAPLRG